MGVVLKPGVVAWVPVGELERDETQPRKYFPDAVLDEMLAKIKGTAPDKPKIHQPLLVRQVGKRKIIFDGEVRWRAAKRGRITKLPCLLKEGLDDAVDRGAGQVVTSVARNALNVMDIAEWLTDLRKREKRTPNELLAALNQRGLLEIGAVKLDKLMRLVDLPEWFKDRIRDGKLSEAVAQAVVPAIGFPKVLKLVEQDLKQTMQWQGAVTVRDATDHVRESFYREGTNLNADHDADRRHFAIDQCRRCEFYKKIGSTELCLNRAEFDKKNRDAMKLLQEKKGAGAAAAVDRVDPRTNPDPLAVPPRKLKTNDAGMIATKRMQWGSFTDLSEAKFDVTTCAGCPHKHKASRNGGAEDADAGDHCFHVPCFQTKQAAGGRQESRRERMREYFERWLRPVVLRVWETRLQGHERNALIVWLATGAVEKFSKWYPAQRHEVAAKCTRPLLERHQLTTLPQFMVPAAFAKADDLQRELALAAIKATTRDQVRWLANYMQVNLSEAGTQYRIDADYLALKRKGELAELAKLGGLETIAGLGVEELRQALLALPVMERIGVPADIQSIYAEPYDRRADDDPDELAADELADEMMCIGCGCTEHDPCETPTGPCGWARRAWNHGGQALGVCTAPECHGHLKRWDNGDRDPSPEAAEHRKMTLQMMGEQPIDDSDDDVMDAVAEEIAAAPSPARSKRGRK